MRYDLDVSPVVSLEGAAARPEQIYRLATCNDFVQMRSRFRDAAYGNAGQMNVWSLKMCGLMWALDNVRTLKPKRVLEVGGGIESFFDNRLSGLGVEEYWMIDRPWAYHPHLEQNYRHRTGKREGVRFIEGSMGGDSHALPNDYFDMVFTVGVWSHRDEGDGPVAYPTLERELRDCRRVLKPGGAFINSTNFTIPPEPSEGFPTILASRMKMAGFNVQAALPLRPKLSGDVTMLENLGVVWEGFKNSDEKVWERMPSVESHYAAIVSRHYR